VVIPAMRAWGLVAALACAAPGCARDGGADRPAVNNPDTRGPNMSTPELQIVVDAEYLMGMGYGHVWKARVREVKAGTLADPEVSLSTFPNGDGARYGGRFKGLGTEQGVTLSLRRIAKRPAALVGFVAKDGTIWEVVEVH
jgi:hypothetical protein